MAGASQTAIGYLYLQDSNQIMDANNSNTPILLDLVKCNNQYELIELGDSHRCPIEVIKFANAVLELKLVLTRGVIDDFQQRNIHVHKEQQAQSGPDVNSVQWFESLDAIKNRDEFVKAINQSPDVLIITGWKTQNSMQEAFYNPIGVYNRRGSCS